MTNAALRVIHLIERDRLPDVTASGQPSIQAIDGQGRVASSTPDLARAPRMSTAVPSGGNADCIQYTCDLPPFPGQCNVLAVFRVYRSSGDWLVYSTAEATIPWYVTPSLPTALLVLSLGLVALTWFGVSRIGGRHARAGGSDPRLPGRDRRRRRRPAGAGTRHRDEIWTLAETANQTLDRLEAAVEQQRRFASDASHDLRSPLTAMRTQVEEALLLPGRTPTGPRPAGGAGQPGPAAGDRHRPAHAGQARRGRRAAKDRRWTWRELVGAETGSAARQADGHRRCSSGVAVTRRPAQSSPAC